MPETRILKYGESKFYYNLYNYTVEAKVSNDRKRHPSYLGVIKNFYGVFACATTLKEVERLLRERIQLVMDEGLNTYRDLIYRLEAEQPRYGIANIHQRKVEQHVL